MHFQIGEKVVYPSYGVGTVESISARTFGSSFEQFYLLRFGNRGVTVMAPFSRAASMGIRRVCRRGEVGRVLAYLAGTDCAVNADWKARFKQNTEKICSGDLLKAAEVLKCLLRVSQDRTLSFREKRMLGIARCMLVAEISVSRGTPEAVAAIILERSLRKAGLALPVAA